MSSSVIVDPIYVVDTHTLVWYLTFNKRLSSTASEIFQAAERGETRLIVSAIVVAEMYFVNQKTNVFPDLHATYWQIRSKPYFRFVPVTSKAMLDFDHDAAIPDMHDRIIVGLARRLSVPVITTDKLITASGLVKIVW
jgi:PIN domain nuclease of toxin-antitoxin system